MEQEKEKKVFVHIDNYTGEKPIEIIYREDEAKNHQEPIKVWMPETLNIKGTIVTVREWLGKRKDLIDINNCRLVVDRDAAKMTLIINECNSRPSFEEWQLQGLKKEDLCVSFAPRSTISGSIEFTDTYKKLRINDDFFWNPIKLSKFLRLNRAIFGTDNKEDGMALVSLLKNVRTKMTGDYEKKKELHGQISKTEYFNMEISHNLPQSFIIELSIFKGSPKEKYEIEIDSDFVDGEILVQLLSPAVNEDVENARDTLIDNELDAIKLMCPNLVIVEV